jgi:hypothetical protein
MDLKQNPFSLYDFLGYFTPGALFLYGLMAAYAHAQPDITVLGYITATLSFKTPEVYIPFILVAYATGHLLSFLSSITVERYSIWAFGYPSKYLLDLSPDGYFEIREKRGIRIVMRTIVAILLTPIVAMDWLLGEKAGLRDLYAKKLDPLLIAILKNKLHKLVIEHANIKKPSAYGTADEHDYFRYAYHYTVENAPNHLPKMQNYVALYGFLRTLTLLVVVIFWGLVWHAVRGTFTAIQSVALLALSILVSYVTFMAFVKFYRRFSLEALMALGASYTKPT